MDKKGIGILAGHRISYIDHIVPLCQILGVPILVTEPLIRDLIEIYYPPMEVILAQPEDYCLDEALEGYDFYVYTEYWRKGHGTFQFAEYITHHRARSVFGFHGNLDKLLEIFWFERVADEDITLFYGPLMQDLITAKGLENRIKNPIFCGNYRLDFYLKHRDFFDRKVLLPKGKPILLYAPTWTSANRMSELRYGYSSFEQVYRNIFEQISDEVHLVVKLHPHHLFLMSEEIEKIQEAFPHVQFLHHFPLIYPLFNQIDFYLGDRSSVGFDFLYFDRPMFFLTNEESFLLRQCGEGIQLNQLSNILQMKDRFSEKRKEVYDYAYGPSIDLKEEVCRLLQ